MLSCLESQRRLQKQQYLQKAYLIQEVQIKNALAIISSS